MKVEIINKNFAAFKYWIKTKEKVWIRKTTDKKNKWRLSKPYFNRSCLYHVANDKNATTIKGFLDDKGIIEVWSNLYQMWLDNGTTKEDVLIDGLSDSDDVKYQLKLHQSKSTHWRAEINEKYYFFGQGFNVIHKTTEKHDDSDNCRWRRYNYFKTRKEIESAYKKINELLRTMTVKEYEKTNA